MKSNKIEQEEIVRYEETQYGFIYGAAQIERMFSIKLNKSAGFHSVLRIKTPRQVVQIRITPTGLIRVSDIRKNGMDKNV